jgi:hypothetical protein
MRIMAKHTVPTRLPSIQRDPVFEFQPPQVILEGFYRRDVSRGRQCAILMTGEAQVLASKGDVPGRRSFRAGMIRAWSVALFALDESMRPIATELGFLFVAGGAGLGSGKRAVGRATRSGCAAGKDAGRQGQGDQE